MRGNVTVDFDRALIAIGQGCVNLNKLVLHGKLGERAVTRPTRWHNSTGNPPFIPGFLVSRRGLHPLLTNANFHALKLDKCRLLSSGTTTPSTDNSTSSSSSSSSSTSNVRHLSTYDCIYDADNVHKFFSSPDALETFECADPSIVVETILQTIAALSKRLECLTLAGTFVISCLSYYILLHIKFDIIKFETILTKY